jgi:hypothetical protein
MPLTAKGSKVMANMKEQYGEEKGEEVFYASKNKGTIKGVDNTPSMENPRDHTWPVALPGDTILQIDVYRSGRVKITRR